MHAPLRHALRSLLAVATACAAADAQSLVAVGYLGEAVRVDLPGGAVTTLGTTGIDRPNALAERDGEIWIAGRMVGSSGDRLAILDPATGQSATVATLSLVNVGGLAFDALGTLFATENGTFGSNDGLYRVDPTTGAATLVGNTGLAGLVSLELFQGQLYGWDCSSGLVTIDTTTAATSDVDAFIGGSCVAQTLVAAANGTLLGVKDAIYNVNTSNGALSGTGIDLLPDLRGAVWVPPPIGGSPSQISLSAGGAQSIAIAAGPQHAGRIFLLLGSVSGTAPGIPVEALTLPLNVDAYFFATLTAPNAPPLAGSLGTLDAGGAATASFSLQPLTNPALAGLTAQHAYVVLDAQPALLSVPFVSPALSVVLVP